MVGEWQHAGSLYRFVQGLPWDNGPETVKGRRQELVLIGPGLDTAALEKELDLCLLTDDEMELKHPRRSSRSKKAKHSSPEHGHGHGHGQTQDDAGEDAEDENEEAAAPVEPEPHGHGHGHGAHVQEAHGHSHHHGHAHDSHGNCVEEEVDPEDEPWKWWRALGKDSFPAFEVDCCAGAEAVRHATPHLKPLIVVL